MINETHDQDLKSWIESANDPNTDFPIQNLPFCRFVMKSFMDYISQFVGKLMGETREEMFEKAQAGAEQ